MQLLAGLGARPELVNSEHWAAANLPPLDVPLTQLKDAAQAAMLSKQKLPSDHLSSQNIDMLMQPNLFPAAGKLAAAVHTAATVDTTNCKSELEIAGARLITLVPCANGIAGLCVCSWGMLVAQPCSGWGPRRSAPPSPRACADC